MNWNRIKNAAFIVLLLITILVVALAAFLVILCLHSAADRILYR